MSADDFVFSTLIANHPDPASASRALAMAEAAVLRKAADAINALPQDYECDPGWGDAAERLRRTADGIEKKTGHADGQEKSSPTGVDATPEPEPYTDSETAFMQIGTAHWPRRAVLHVEGLPPLVGTYNGAGMRRLDTHAGLIVEPMLAFADRPETPGEDGRS